MEKEEKNRASHFSVPRKRRLKEVIRFLSLLPLVKEIMQKEQRSSEVKRNCPNGRKLAVTDRKILGNQYFKSRFFAWSGSLTL